MSADRMEQELATTMGAELDQWAAIEKADREAQAQPQIRQTALPSARLISISDGHARTLAECQQTEQQIEDQRTRLKAAFQATHDAESAACDAEIDRVNAEIAALHAKADRIIEKKRAIDERISGQFERIDDMCDREAAANNAIRRQAHAALATTATEISPETIDQPSPELSPARFAT